MQTADVIRRAEAVKPTSRNKIEGAKATQRKSRGHTGAVMLAVLAGTMGLGGVASQASAQWLPNFQVYTPTRIGLFGAGYTSSSGVSGATATGMNASGQVIGNSSRFGDGTGGGADAWFFNGTTTQQVGLVGPGYSASTGRRVSNARLVSDSGHVAGETFRLAVSGTSLGQDAWVFNGLTTQQVGLIGGPFTSSDGTRSSSVSHLRSGGGAAGQTNRYNGLLFSGQSAWYFDGSSTQEIGLSGPQFVRSNGFRSSSVQALNGAGRAIGITQRYLPSGASENDAWLFDGTSTQQIGLTTGVNVSAAGNRVSGVSGINQVGQVIGQSNRYAADGTSLGTDGWLYNGSSYQLVGLTTAEHATSSGLRTNVPERLNDAGQAVGRAVRYSSAGEAIGLDYWYFNGSSTQLIGLTGPDYTSSSGVRSSTVNDLSATGFVIGRTSATNAAGANLGADAWFFDGANTQRIGLTGVDHRAPSGERVSSPITLNAAGQVIGNSSRYSGTGGFLGQDAWYFDRATGITTAVVTGSQSATGFRLTAPRILTDNGYMLGEYNFYTNPAVNHFESRAFVFRPDLGFIDLGALVNGSLSSFGIQTLQDVRFANLLDVLVVTGRIGTNSTGVYIMVPSPGVGTVLGLGLLAAWRRKR